jgi:hypothetical protein
MISHILLTAEKLEVQLLLWRYHDESVGSLPFERNVCPRWTLVR